MSASDLRETLHAERTKLRTAPATGWLLLAVAVTTVAVGAASAAVTVCTTGACDVDATRVALAGVQLGQAVVAALAVLMIGDEYGTGMVRVTLTAMPRRVTVLGAKAAVLTVVVTAAATPAVLGSLLAGWFILPGRPAMSLTDGPVLRAVTGSVLYLALIGLLSLGVATAVRNSVAAAGLVLALLYVFPVVVLAVNDQRWQHRLERIGPTAGLAVQATTGLDRLPIGPWAGLGVLAGWAAAALCAGAVLLWRRDA